jgi:pimeloyl-ACP methyl ester carboxylesterase
MDHLGIGEFCVMGCCIGCSYALGLAARAPERIRAAVLEQPIGLTEKTRDYWVGRRQAWVTNLVATRNELDADDGERFGAAMWSRDFVGCVSRDVVTTLATPILVLPGTDDVHPTETGREVGRLVPGAEIVEPWKHAPHVASATSRVRDFLHAHSRR